MRWHRPKTGDTRIIKKFLLLPKTIGNQTRWLEWANIVQKYAYYERWYDYRWLDVENEK